MDVAVCPRCMHAPAIIGNRRVVEVDLWNGYPEEIKAPYGHWIGALRS